MIIQGPQTVYNTTTNLDSQNLTSRTDALRNQGAGTAPKLEEKLALEKQAENQIHEPPDISLQQVKNLSDIFNTYQSYVNQVDAENTIIGRISRGVLSTPDTLAIT